MIKSASVVADRVLIDDADLADYVRCTLPDMQWVTTTLKGAGVMGAIDLPHPGRAESLVFTMDLRAVGENAALAIKPGSRKIELRFLRDVLDSNGGAIAQGTKVFITGLPKGINAGSVEQQATMDGSVSYEVLRYRMVVEGKEVFLLDKLNGVFKVDGVDYGSSYKL